MPNLIKSLNSFLEDLAATGQGANLTDGYCKLDSQITPDSSEQYTLFNMRENYQINCYIVPNYLQDSSRFDMGSCVHFDWQSDVHALTFEDKLFDLGTHGSLIVKDSFGNLSYLLEQYMNYDLVINILWKITEKGIVRFDPYVLDIISVKQIASVEQHTKFLQIDFEDIFTAEAKRHSVGTLIKYDPELRQSKTFPEIFKKIFDYINGIIELNMNNAFKYGKELKFNNYLPSDESSIIECVIDTIEPHNSIYDLLVALCRDACVEIWPDDKLITDFEMMGKMMVPMFFREEFSDMLNYYYVAYNEKPDDLKHSPGGEGAIIRRPWTMRNFFMPFQDAFQANKVIVFESFTTAAESEQKTKGVEAMNGKNPLPIRNVQALSSNTEITNRRWKNLAFLSANPNGTSNRLVFFNWIYEFFNQVFLRGKLGQQGVKFSNVAPNFYLASQTNESLRNNRDFAEKNSNIIMLRNEKTDPLKEIVMEMGKTLASLVFLNNMYSFEVEGSMFRRPNEIINLYTPQSVTTLVNQVVCTDFAKSENVVFYVTAVVHTFSGNTFTDKVICNRVYEQVKKVS